MRQCPCSVNICDERLEESSYQKVRSSDYEERPQAHFFREVENSRVCICAEPKEDMISRSRKVQGGRQVSIGKTALHPRIMRNCHHNYHDHIRPLGQLLPLSDRRKTLISAGTPRRRLQSVQISFILDYIIIRNKTGDRPAHCWRMLQGYTRSPFWQRAGVGVPWRAHLHSVAFVVSRR